MSVLSAYFDKECSQNSPIVDDYILVPKETQDGTEMVPEKVDYPEIQKSHGTVEDWSLDALLKAGINPASLGVHTGYTNRLEGIDELSAVSAEVEAAFENVESPKTE